MKTSQLALLALAIASPAFAAPGVKEPRDAAVTVTYTVPATKPSAPAAYDWTKDATPDFPIHSSCNATQRNLLKHAMQEGILLAEHARDHILRFGNDSFYTTYFGTAPTGEVIGWYSKVAASDRAGTLFRCDDPDKECETKGYVAYWRGDAAPTETVMCPKSFLTLKPLEGMCGYGFDIATGTPGIYYGAEIMHRCFHMPRIGEGVVADKGDSYSDVTTLAKTSPGNATRSIHSLQFFAVDVYAYDIALPGEGCPGTPLPASSSAAAPTAAASSASPSKSG